MRIEQRTRSGAGWSPVARPLGSKAQLALAFAPTTRLTEHQTWTELVALYPGARIVGCATAGEISSIARKLVLDHRIEAEVEAARGVLGNAVTTGFYACGQIAPFTTLARCELHNQTMTITVLSER